MAIECMLLERHEHSKETEAGQGVARAGHEPTLLKTPYNNDNNNSFLPAVEYRKKTPKTQERFMRCIA